MTHIAALVFCACAAHLSINKGIPSAAQAWGTEGVRRVKEGGVEL